MLHILCMQQIYIFARNVGSTSGNMQIKECSQNANTPEWLVLQRAKTKQQSHGVHTHTVTHCRTCCSRFYGFTQPTPFPILSHAFLSACLHAGTKLGWLVARLRSFLCLTCFRLKQQNMVTVVHPVVSSLQIFTSSYCCSAVDPINGAWYWLRCHGRSALIVMEKQKCISVWTQTKSEHNTKLMFETEYVISIINITLLRTLSLLIKHK